MVIERRGGVGVVETLTAQPQFVLTAIGYNTSVALFGGTAPYVATWLVARTGSNIAPAFYVIAAAVISLGTVLTMRETAGRPLLRLVAAGDNARPGHGTPKR